MTHNAHAQSQALAFVAALVARQRHVQRGRVLLIATLPLSLLITAAHRVAHVQHVFPILACHRGNGDNQYSNDNGLCKVYQQQTVRSGDAAMAISVPVSAPSAELSRVYVSRLKRRAYLAF